MTPTAYIETSVVSYLTSRPSRDIVVVALQQVTREWWQTARDRFQLAASELVIREAGQGDPDAARARLGYEPPVICTPNELMEHHHGDP